MTRVLIAAAALFVFSARAAFPAAFVIRAARMITAVDDRVVAPAVGVGRGDRIVSVGGSVPADARGVDLGAATLPPGPIDLHTHPPSTRGHTEDKLRKTTPRQAAPRGA